MSLTQVNWQQVCCAWHGDYAEHPTRDGGVARLKRGPSVEGVLVMRFSPENKRLDEDYVLMSEAEVEKLL